ncbi:LrgB family protein [Clostridium sp. CF012]|nr:LrgB family protein [Clostridium sp. CF012]MBU3145950.1 LrgB family protein [Clostridium sp. CF012]
MKELLATPIFGIMLSLIAFEIGYFIYNKTKFSLLNPLLIAITLVIVFLLKFNIKLEDYNNGAQLISFFLGPFNKNYSFTILISIYYSLASI